MNIPTIALYRGEGLQHSARLTRPKLILILDKIIEESCEIPGNYSMHVEFNGKKRHFNFWIPFPKESDRKAEENFRDPL